MKLTKINEPAGLRKSYTEQDTYFLRNYIGAVNSNPNKLEQIEQRLQFIHEIIEKIWVIYKGSC